jgi:hypothetical protein
MVLATDIPVFKEMHRPRKAGAQILKIIYLGVTTAATGVAT